MSASGPNPGADARESTVQTTVRVRRAPRYLPFILCGVVLFLIIATVLTFVFPVATGFTRAQILGFLLVCGAIVGVAVGCTAAIVVDRISSARATSVLADRLTERDPEQVSDPAAAITENDSVTDHTAHTDTDV